MTVSPVNDAPVAVDDPVAITGTAAVVLDVLANDYDVDSPNLTIKDIATPTTQGTVFDNGDGTLTYTPVSTGTDRFDYTISDGDLSDTAAVTISVSEVYTEVEPPIQLDWTFTTSPEGTPVTTTVNIAPDSVTETVTLVYTDTAPSDMPPSPPGISLAGRSFRLLVYLSGQLQPSFAFKQPVTLTLTYDPIALGGLDETTLDLWFWDTTARAWSQTGISLVSRDPAADRIVFTLTHMTDFALGGPQPNTAPDAPSTPYPEDNATDVVHPVLSWFGGDVDADPVTYTIAFGVNNPPPVLATTDEDVFLLPGLQGSSRYYWQITASDGISQTTGPLWSFTTAPNQAPSISGTPLRKAKSGKAYAFTPQASDPDGDDLTFDIHNQPGWAAFDSTTGRLSGTPAANDAGTTAGIVITASDGISATALAPFDITVEDLSSLYGPTPASLVFHVSEGTAGEPQTVVWKFDANNPGEMPLQPDSQVSWLKGGDGFPAEEIALGEYQYQVTPQASNLALGTYTSTLSGDVWECNREMGTYQCGQVLGQYDIPVTLIVEPAKLKVSRTQLQFGALQGAPAPAPSQLRLKSSGPVAVDWSATIDQNWVTLSRQQGQTPTQLEVGIDADNLPATGIHTATLTLSSTMNTISVRIVLNVASENDELIELTALEVTQGLQNLRNDATLVANRRTYVRAHVRSRSAQSFDGVKAKLTVSQDGTPLGAIAPINPNGSITVLPDPQRSSLNDSFLFALPENWRNGEITLEFAGTSLPIACRDPHNLANDCQATVTFAPVPAMALKFIYGTEIIGDDVIQATDQTRDCTLRDIEAKLPVSDIDVSVSADTLTLQQDGSKSIASTLDELVKIWERDGRPKIHYYGLFDRSGPESRGSDGVAAVGGFTGVGGYFGGTGPINPHELGHNLDQGHAPCDVQGDPGFYEDVWAEHLQRPHLRPHNQGHDELLQPRLALGYEL